MCWCLAGDVVVVVVVFSFPRRGSIILPDICRSRSHCGAVRRMHRGLPYMTSAKISDFFDPLVTVKNQLIVFLLSAFWGPPPPPTADVIYGSPQRTPQPQSARALRTMGMGGRKGGSGLVLREWPVSEIATQDASE